MIIRRFECCCFGGFTISTFYSIDDVKDITTAKKYQSLFIHMNNKDDLFLSLEHLEENPVSISRKKLTHMESLDSQDLDKVFEPTRLQKTRSKTLIPTAHDFVQSNGSSKQIDTNRIDFIIDRLMRVYYLKKHRILNFFEFAGEDKAQLLGLGSSLKLKKKHSVLLGSKPLNTLRKSTIMLSEEDAVPTEFDTQTIRILYSRPFRRGDNTQFSTDRLAVVENLGCSLFGIDYLCKDLRGGALCIKKKCSLDYLRNAFGLRPDEMAESLVMNMDLSDYFPHIYQIRLCSSELEVYHSYFECGSLQRLLAAQPDGCVDEAKACRLASVIAEGIETMHMLDVKLGILSTRTFCISKQGELFFDIVWFLSRHIAAFKPQEIKAVDLQYVGRLPLHPAPEVVQSGIISKCGDWWTLGAILFEMVFGFTPFYSQSPSAMQKNKQSKLDWNKLPRLICTTSLRDLLSKLLCPNPHDRLGWKEGMAEVMAHPWFIQHALSQEETSSQRRVVCSPEETQSLSTTANWEAARTAELQFLDSDNFLL